MTQSMLVEIEAGISAGVFGRLAAGQNNIFAPADPKRQRRRGRIEARRRAGRSEGPEMARSERLASICPPLWELRTGRRREQPEWFSVVEQRDLASPIVDRIVERLDEFAARWRALPEGGSMTLVWPKISHASSRRRS